MNSIVFFKSKDFALAIAHNLLEYELAKEKMLIEMTAHAIFSGTILIDKTIKDYVLNDEDEDLSSLGISLLISNFEDINEYAKDIMRDIEKSNDLCCINKIIKY